jgi:ribosomal-protein-alanine N-acetyltransferase
MTVTVRPADLTDVPALLAIEQQAPGAAHWKSDEYTKLVNSEIILVAEEAGRLMGFVCAKIVAGEWEIENVAVASEFLRRGVASALIHDLIRRSETRSAAAILLEVRESNLPARRLYEKHGFREVGRRRGYYQTPVEDAILYSREVGRETL